MYGLKRMLDQEEERLIQINNTVNGRLTDVPSGSLIVSSAGAKRIYRLKSTDENGNSNTTYIKKENQDLVCVLAQKEYDEKMKALIDRRLKQVARLRKGYSDTEIEDIYNNLHDAKKQFVMPAEPTWEQRVAQWKNTPYKGKEFDENSPQIYTKKGERVRSKSEKILADTFYALGIEYKYECPIRLKGYGIVYPDFTFMSKYCNGPMYWEHDGKMDDPKYAEKAVRKIDSYIKNGIFPGERLIVTYETSNYTLDERVVKELIDKYLL